MANHKSSKKRILRNNKRNEINSNRISRIRTYIKRVETEISSENKELEKLKDQLLRTLAENENLRKNRLELVNMLCKTFQNFINFQLLKTNNE